ncbi:hypothetical protein SK128_015496 [Halocaridina rubra]|uniref:Uncharacterized protein n=1 Tax=Halocaridina rubra TaxID=373956 RepID=A0AAN8X681_HALRR
MASNPTATIGLVVRKLKRRMDEEESFHQVARNEVECEEEEEEEEEEAIDETVEKENNPTDGTDHIEMTLYDDEGNPVNFVFDKFYMVGRQLSPLREGAKILPPCSPACRKNRLIRFI